MSTRTLLTAVGALTLTAAATAGCAALQGSAPGATAVLRNAQGAVVAQATFTQTPAGVRLVVDARGLPPGDKGIHIHEVGRCEPPAFTSAGGHFNPGRRQHGLENPAGPHAGDLPNLHIDAQGTGRLETTTDRVTLGSGPTSLFDADGSALVIHAAPDDHRTDPAGNSGARIACGVITRAAAGAAGGRSGY
jgi:Cu-Zn family superoxide dismutase